MIDGGDGVSHQRLPFDIVELGVFENHLDRFPFADLCLEVLDHSALDQSRPEPPGVLTRLHGHQLDFGVQVRPVHLEFLFLGNPIEHEVLLDRLPGGGNGVLSNLVFPGLDFLRGESRLLHLEDLSSQGVLGLLGDEFFGQVPVGALGDPFQHLAAGVLTLAELGLAFESSPQCVFQRVLVLDSEPIEKFRVEFGEVSFLHGGDRESHAERFTSHGDVVGLGGDGDLPGTLFSGGHSGHQFVEPFEFGVLEAEHRTQFEHRFFDSADGFVTVCEREVGNDGVAGFGGSIMIVEVGVLQQELLEIGVDVLVGHLPHRPVDGQTLVVGQIELGPHLHVKLVFEISLFGDIDHVDVEIGFVDRFQVVVFGELFEAADEQFLLDLVGQFTAEPLGDQSRRHVPLAKSGDLGGVGQFPDGDIVDSVDIGARHLDDDMTQAGARLGDLDVQRHLQRTALWRRHVTVVVVRSGFVVDGGRDLGHRRLVFGHLDRFGLGIRLVASFGCRFVVEDHLECPSEKSRERETGFEPATSTLATWCSTTELLPPTRRSRWRSRL